MTRGDEEDAMIRVGDCREVMATMDAESVDAVVTDPPYELAFMGREWDRRGVAFDPETWRVVYRVLKPGARLLAFGGTRTNHRMVCAIEDAGFVIEDTICWLHGQGFPKHASKLKPAHEPICVAWKPDRRATALNIDACRVGTDERLQGSTVRDDIRGGEYGGGHRPSPGDIPLYRQHVAGRWPANVVLSHIPPDEHGNGGCREVGTKRVTSNGHYPKARGKGGIGNDGHAGQDDLDERHTSGEVQTVWDCARDESGAYLCPVALLDQQSGERGGGFGTENRAASIGRYGDFSGATKGKVVGYGDTGGASRFFYVAKASRSEREMGMEDAPQAPVHRYGEQGQGPLPQQTPRVARPQGNFHPTVKPLALMRWLVRLACPPDGLILDPFAGSGTTGMAAILEGFRFVGIEQSEEYARIAERRIAYWSTRGNPTDAVPRQLAMVAD